jgi:hypothetical protein
MFLSLGFPPKNRPITTSLFLTVSLVGPTRNRQDGTAPLIGFPLLLIQYIRGYPP